MAIVIEGRTNCSICDVVMEAGTDIVMFPHFIQDDRHPLWRFSDSGMHCGCFVHWDKAEAFRQAYDEFWPALMPRHLRTILANGTIVDLPRASGD
jgi:hypothetical protein